MLRLWLWLPGKGLGPSHHTAGFELSFRLSSLLIPAAVFLPGESQGQRSLVGCRLWGRTESDMTDVTQQQQQNENPLSVMENRDERRFFLKTKWHKVNFGEAMKPFM